MAETEKPPTPRALWPIVFTGILAISSASILIRLADAPSLTIAAYRVTLAALCLTPWVLRERSAVPDKTAIPWGPLFLSGLFLALHFAFWIESLKKTTVASSVTLVSISPVFTAIFSSFFFKEHPHPLMRAAIGVCIAGTACVAGFDFRIGVHFLMGDLMALLGALMASGYFLAGRYVRRTLPLPTYIFGSYGTAGGVLIAFCVLSRTPLHGFSFKTSAILVLLALVPQLIGHTSFNWALKHLSATAVAAFTLGEPLGATALAFVLFNETVTLPKALGLGLLATGIALSARASSLPPVRSRSREA